MANDDWVATARLRYVLLEMKQDLEARGIANLPDSYKQRFLQQWFAPDVPGYMRRDAEGEWRDVPVEEATAP